MKHYRRHSDRRPSSSTLLGLPRPALFFITAALGLCVAVGSVVAEDQAPTGNPAVFTSGVTPVPLVELFTSEGCSSCPPADRWISQLKTHKGLWKDFVPVAFHVNYWDSIGWPDRFAQESFGQRQRQYAREGAVRGVYTPGVIAGGKEWHGWRQGRSVVSAAPPDAGQGDELRATLDDKELRVRYTQADAMEAPLGRYRVHVAWLAMEQVSDVRRGENRGKRLVNDFVVLGKVDKQLPKADGKSDMVLPLGKDAENAGALAVWISADGLQRPIQATGGWIP